MLSEAQAPGAGQARAVRGVAVMATVAHRMVPDEPSDAPRAGEPARSPSHVAARLSLQDRLLGVRDRILANPGFQRFAGTFALTRPIARRRAGALFDLCAGFVYSQILLACVRLKLFEHLADGPLSAAELSTRLSLPAEQTALLLDAAVSLKLAAAPQRRPLWPRSARRGAARQSRRRRHDRASRDALRRPRRSGRAAARRGRGRAARALLALCRQATSRPLCPAMRSRPTPR